MLHSYLWGKEQTTCVPAFTDTHTLLKTYVAGTINVFMTALSLSILTMILFLQLTIMLRVPILRKIF